MSRLAPGRVRLQPGAWLLVAAGLAAGPAPAQEVPPGARLTIGIDNRLEAANNLALERPSPGSTVLAASVLRLGLLSETRTERLAVDFDGRLRIGRDERERVAGLDDTGLTFSYSREGGNALLGLDGRLRSADIRTFRLLDDLPPGFDEEDFDALRAARRGTRRDAGLDGRLELGREGPLGLTLQAGYGSVRYRDTGEADLTETDTVRFAAIPRAQLTPVLSATLELSRSRLRERSAADGAFLRREVADRVGVGLAYEVSPRLRLEGGVGVLRIATREPDTRRRADGLDARLGGTLALPDGTLSGEIARGFTAEGTRDTLRLTRVLERPLGAIEVSLGVAVPEDGNARLVGAGLWRHELPRGEISARISRELASADADETRVITSAAADLSHALTAVSSLTLGLAHSVRSAGADSPRLEQSRVSASYTHQLTVDWALSAGLGYTTEREAGSRRVSSPSVFLGLGREFSFGL